MKRLRRMVFLIATFVLLGCGGATAIDPADTVEVTGKVTLDGKPLGDAEIYMIPVDGDQSIGTFMGQADNQGNYSIAGVLPGEYEVRVQHMADGEPNPALEKYAAESPLRAQVTKDKTTFDFELTSSR